MRIVAYYTVYNEMRLLPYQYKWLKSQGVEMYVIDNCSNDKTDKWLKQNHIRHHSIDTGGAFDLRLLLVELEKQIHIDKPDWFIYSGMDMFFVYGNGTLVDLAMLAQTAGKTSVPLFEYTFYHTSDAPDAAPSKGNPFKRHLFYRPNADAYSFMSKYHPEVAIIPDHVVYPDAKPLDHANAAIFEMHAAKSITDRMETFARRQKAWQNGLNANHGNHYRQLAQRGFIYPENQQTNISSNPDLFKLYRKLINL